MFIVLFITNPLEWYCVGTAHHSGSKEQRMPVNLRLEVKEKKRKRLVSHNLSHPKENALDDLRPSGKLPLLRISSTSKLQCRLGSFWGYIGFLETS